MPLTLLLVVAMVIGFWHGLGCPEPAAVVVSYSNTNPHNNNEI